MKIPTINVLKVLGLSLLAILSSACNQENKVADTLLKKSLYEARTVKPHASIYMQYTLPQNIEVGRSMVVDVVIMSGKKADNLNVNLHLSQGLFSVDALSYVLGAQHAGQKNSLSFVVQADIKGEYKIHLDASLLTKESTQSRSFIVPIKVGKISSQTQLKPNGIMADDGIEKIISMPAKETHY